MTVRAIRWFGGGKCLVVDEETEETFTAARLVPGERATLQRFERAGRRVPVADQILTSSPHRQPSICPRYDRCTGCDLLHVSEAEETRYKQTTVREVLQRFADVEVERVEVVGSSARGNHRARARFALERDDGHVRLGLRDFSGDVLDTTECPANAPDVRDTLRTIRRLTRELPGLSVSGVEVSSGVEGVAVVFDVPAEANRESFGELVNNVMASEGVAAAALRPENNGVDIVAGVWPRQVPIGDIQLESAVEAWVQPTPAQAAALYGWVSGLGLHHGARVLDATCGTGGLSLALAPEAREILGVDANWSAVKSATASAGALGCAHVRFRGGKIETVAPRLLATGESFELVIVNPMRRSLGAAAMSDLAALASGAMLYLAPAPRAGAEDVGDLVRLGFTVRRVAAVNLHPGTAKVLMAVLLTR